MADPTGRSWLRIEEALHRVRSGDPAERSRLLAEACGSDPDLRAQVEKLLAGGDAAGNLDKGAGVASSSVPTSADLPAGMMFGAYRIIRLVGRGGMGEVYLAERADGQFEQQVAIKLLRAEAR